MLNAVGALVTAKKTGQGLRAFHGPHAPGCRPAIPERPPLHGNNTWAAACAKDSEVSERSLDKDALWRLKLPPREFVPQSGRHGVFGPRCSLDRVAGHCLEAAATR